MASLGRWAEGALASQWLFTLGAWALVALALYVLWWALLRDRARGRARCPRCWYDMAGLVAATSPAEVCQRCPECGRGIATPRALHRTRRRWGVATLALLPLLGAWPLAQTPALRRDGAWELVPTWVLVYVWPTDPFEFVDPLNWGSGPHNVLRERLLGRRGPAQSELVVASWADTLERAFAREGRLYVAGSGVTPRGSPPYLMVIDAQPLVISAHALLEYASIPWPQSPFVHTTFADGAPQDQRAEDISRLVDEICMTGTRVITPSAWDLNGGNEAIYQVLGSRRPRVLVTHHDARALEDFDRLVRLATHLTAFRPTTCGGGSDTRTTMRLSEGRLLVARTLAEYAPIGSTSRGGPELHATDCDPGVIPQDLLELEQLRWDIQMGFSTDAWFLVADDEAMMERVETCFDAAVARWRAELANEALRQRPK